MQAAANDDGRAPEASLAQPVRQRGIEVVTVGWEPGREFARQGLRRGVFAVRDAPLHALDRAQHCVVLGDMALARREVALDHPRVLGIEVGAVLSHGR